MKKLHDLIIQNNLVNALLSIKDKGIKHVAMDGDGKIHAFIKDNVYYSENCAFNSQWVTDFDYCMINEHYFLIGNINPITINPKDSFEEIDWDYLAGIGSNEPEYDTDKLGDLYQALLDGHIIRSFIVGEAHQFIKFDNKDQKFKVSSAIFDPEKQHFKISDKDNAFVAKNLPVNKLFLDNNEIYTPPKERLWIGYNYTSVNGVAIVNSRFIPIDHTLTNEDGYTWFKTEEVR